MTKERESPNASLILIATSTWWEADTFMVTA